MFQPPAKYKPDVVLDGDAQYWWNISHEELQIVAVYDKCAAVSV